MWNKPNGIHINCELVPQLVWSVKLHFYHKDVSFKLSELARTYAFIWYIIPVASFNVPYIWIYYLASDWHHNFSHFSLVIDMKDITCSINHKTYVVFYSYDMLGFCQKPHAVLISHITIQNHHSNIACRSACRVKYYTSTLRDVPVWYTLVCKTTMKWTHRYAITLQFYYKRP